jgi:FMN phosphatase YigB (HAD superfamily)
MDKIVVFDIGGVLVDWQPHLAWVDELGSDAAALAFMERINFPALNLRGDNGEAFADLARELEDVDDRARLTAYVGHYTKTVVHRIPGTWDVLDDLLDQGTPLHAITNWSAETWPEGLKAHPRLADVFGTIVVSGQEGIIKPDIRIFELLCLRAGVAAGDCIFIDDSEKNVAGAKVAGMDAIHFTGAEALRADLVQRGVL